MLDHSQHIFPKIYKKEKKKSHYENLWWHCPFPQDGVGQISIYLVPRNLGMFTGRIQGMGKVIFSLCVSVHTPLPGQQWEYVLRSGRYVSWVCSTIYTKARFRRLCIHHKVYLWWKTMKLIMIFNRRIYSPWNKSFGSVSKWIEKVWLPCWLQYSQQVSPQRWIWGIRCVQARKHANKGSNLALKPRADIPKSVK